MSTETIPNEEMSAKAQRLGDEIMETDPDALLYDLDWYDGGVSVRVLYPHGVWVEHGVEPTERYDD